jgi:hypothetical protein
MMGTAVGKPMEPSGSTTKRNSLKTIQTKRRANMVYAIKIKVKNDGTYKIGMYAEVRFAQS